MKNIALYCLAVLFLFLSVSSCKNKNNNSDSVIPNVAVNLIINLNDNLYFDLKNDGGFAYIPNVGVKGILLYHSNATNYTAFERASPINPYGKCNIIMMDPSRIFLEDTCAKATFDLSGNSTDGATANPLKKYYVEVSNSKLQITNIHY